MFRKQVHPSHDVVEFRLPPFGYKNVEYRELSGSVICPTLTASAEQAHVQLAHEASFDWAKKQKLINDQDDRACKKLEAAKFASMMGNVLHDQSDLGLFADLVTVFVMLDDVIEKFAAKIPQSYGIIKAVLDSLLKIFTGEHKQSDAMPPIKFPLYESFYHAFFDIHQRVLQKQDNIQHLIAAIDVCFKATLNTIRIHSAHEKLTEEAYLENRKYTVGMAIVFELCCILKGVKLSADNRKSTAFTTCNDKALKILAVFNDIISLPKEILEKNDENFILIKSSDLAVSFQEAVAYVNQEMKALFEVIASAQQNTELQQYTNLIKNILRDCMQWHLLSKRYDPRSELSPLQRFAVNAASAPANKVVEPVTNNTAPTM